MYVHVIVIIAHATVIGLALVIVFIKNMNFKESEIKFESQIFFEKLKEEILSKSKVCPSDFIQKQFEGKSLRKYNISILDFLKDTAEII